jgi:ribonuclease G
VLKVLRKALDEDRTKTFVVEISPLGLVEMTRQNVTDGAREIMTKACPTCGGEGVVKSEETIAIEAERRLRELVAEAGADGPEAYLVRMNPKVTAYFTADGARTLHGLEEETNRFFHFTGSEGLPLDHFAVVEAGARAEIEEQSVPFREGEEVHVDIVEPHMYSEDDAVAKVDGYLIEVADGIPYVGEKMLVRIEQAGRTAARAVLTGDVAQEAAEASEERRRSRERAAKRAASAAKSRPRKKPEPAPRAPQTQEDEAVETLADDDTSVHAGPGPAAVAEADEDAARPRGRRRTRGAGKGSEQPIEESDESATTEPSDDDDAVQSKPRRRGRRGGRRRSRAKAESDAAEVSDASE